MRKFTHFSISENVLLYKKYKFGDFFFLSIIIILVAFFHFLLGLNVYNSILISFFTWKFLAFPL